MSSNYPNFTYEYEAVMFLDVHFIIFPMRTGNELFLAYNFLVKYSD